MAYQQYLQPLPQPPMDPYSPPYSPTTFASPTNPYVHHQPFFYPHGASPIPVDDAQYDSNVHPYWKDRVVPRPGFRSPRILGPTAESSRITIKDPTKSNGTHTKQLIPPRSYAQLNQSKSPVKIKEPEEVKKTATEQQPKIVSISV